MNKIEKLLVWIFMVSMMISGETYAQRLKEISSVAGYRGNALIGYGIVVGLNGTGDANFLSSNGAYSGDSIKALLAALDVAGNRSDPRFSTTYNNVAAVIVTAELPPLARPGQKLDITVSSLGSARSLRGGTLLMTPMKGANGQVFALAQGSVVVADLSEGAYPASREITPLTVGRIPGGAYVEQAAPLTEANRLPDSVELNLDDLDYAHTEAVVTAITTVAGAGSATILDGRTVRVALAGDNNQKLALLSKLMETEIPALRPTGKVVINSRTGSVVVNQSVTLQPFAVTHGGLTVRVTGTRREMGAYADPWPENRLSMSGRLEIDTGPKGQMVGVQGGANLEEVVRALNQLGQSPKDLMAILQAMKAAGALNAELEVI